MDYNSKKVTGDPQEPLEWGGGCTHKQSSLNYVQSSWCLLGYLVDGVGQVPDVLGSDSGDGDAAVLGQVDAELFG